MKRSKSFISASLVLLDVDFSSMEQLYGHVAATLEKEGYVKNKENFVQRLKEYDEGVIALSEQQIVVPHLHDEVIVHDFICFVRFTESVPFWSENEETKIAIIIGSKEN
ncbi:MAG: PTS sugar transporter subunit IIA, partial [Bacilli bacterium]